MASFLKKVGNFLFGTPDKVKTQELSAQQQQLNTAIGEEAGRYGDYMGRIKSLYDFTPQEQRMVGEQATKVMGQQAAAQRQQLGSLLSKRPGGLQGAVNYLLAQQGGAQRAQGDALGKLYANLAMQRKQMQQQGLSQEMAAGTNRVRLLSGLQSPTQYIEPGRQAALPSILGAVAMGATAGGPMGLGATLGKAGGALWEGASRAGSMAMATPRLASEGNLGAGLFSMARYGDTSAYNIPKQSESISELSPEFMGPPSSLKAYARGGTINRGSAGLMGEAGRETVVTGQGKFMVDRPTIFMSMARGNITPSQQGQHGIKGKHAGRTGAAAATGMAMGMKGRRSQGHNGWKGQLKRRGA